MAEGVAYVATERPRTSLVDSFVEDLQRLINRNGGDFIDTVSLFLMERIVNDTALLLNIESSYLREAVGITRICAERGRY